LTTRGDALSTLNDTAGSSLNCDDDSAACGGATLDANSDSLNDCYDHHHHHHHYISRFISYFNIPTEHRAHFIFFGQRVDN
jgi:hypothetical protein